MKAFNRGFSDNYLQDSALCEAANITLQGSAFSSAQFVISIDILKRTTVNNIELD